ncbi:MAG: OmpA family protein [Acidobacteriota bacterium]|nr:MAG: OmpA family protein [Acidobacteriota bacterium]
MSYDGSGNNPRNRLPEKTQAFAQTGILILLGICLVVVGVIGFLFYRQLNALGEDVRELNAAVDQVRADLETVGEIASLARSSAMQAEEFARISAEGHAFAEASRLASEERARRAQIEATVARRESQDAKEQLTEFRKQREAEMNRLQAALEKIADTRRTALGLVMNLGSDQIQFDFDKATLKSKNRELLSRIAGVLLTSQGYRVQIYGHTDDVGTVEYNQTLSEQRAETVKKYLVEAGVDSSIITTKGFGKSNPLVPGSTAEARAKNRRVEVGIIDTMISYQGPAEE